ncbi:MAG: hypothetical protein H0T78_03265 [Longispora sp.]|nr:hypothetical protein [Longispora sp. (in: high G+C Gram-positive bacteria)]
MRRLKASWVLRKLLPLTLAVSVCVVAGCTSAPEGDRHITTDAASPSRQESDAPPSSPPRADHSEEGSSGSVYSPGPPTSPSPNALDTAHRFAIAWARPNLADQLWWNGVSTYCEPGLAQLLRTTDPGTVPATRVTGDSRATSSVSDRVTIEIPTDAGTLVATVIKADNAWLVGDIDFRRAVQ